MLIKKYGDKFDNFIYERDIKWIKESDVMIADVTVPSLGVGYEIGFAESLNIPVLCISDKNGHKKVSAMLTGNRNIEVRYYESIDEAKEIIKKYLIDKNNTAII